MELLARWLLAIALTEPIDTIVVQVGDETGPLPGATVTLISHPDPSGPIYTDTEGTVRFAVPCGEHTIQVSMNSFGTQRITNIRNCEGRPGPIEVRLEQEIACVVRIVCGDGPVTLEKTRKSTVFSSAFLSDLPGVGAHEPPPRVDEACVRGKRE